MATCASCGRENPSDARFCNGCGTVLDGVAVAPEERKLVTVLFADVAGSTRLGERLDAEQLKEVMAAFFAAMRAEIEAEGGTVEKFIGDAVMAAFGVPRAHEDDAARALRAALRMRSKLVVLNRELEEQYGVELETRIGINTGEVIATTGPRPGEALATGDAVNAAARLEQLARPGEVLVSERTARAARGFHYGEPRALELRGKAEPLNAQELLGEQPVAEGTFAGWRIPLVGRTRELELLELTYRRVVAEQRPQLVTVYGEAGVGKSRLIGELLARLAAGEDPPTVVRGRCLSYGEGVTYWPLAEILKEYAGVLDSDAADTARARAVEAAAAAIAHGGVERPEELGRTVAASVGLGGSEAGGRTPQELRATAHLAWHAFFSGLASAGPVVVLVEDIHWADPAMLELLEELGDRAHGPLAVVCTARPELTDRRPGWGGGRRSFTGLAVEPLPEGESARLVELLLEDLGLGEEAQAAIAHRSEGNPFFAEELVRALAEERGADIPDTVQGALAARIDLLPPDEKRVLQAASIVGRVFWPGAVAEVAGFSAPSVDEHLDRLRDRDLVLGRLATSLTGQRELIFKHALVRDVAYESLPRRDRSHMHTVLADWVETTYAGRLDEVAELLAHHRRSAYTSGSAELREAAYVAVARAAEVALARGAAEQAQTLAEQAVELASTPLERARGLEALGYAGLGLFEGDVGWESLREAIDIVRAERPAERERLARMCAFVAMVPVRSAGLMNRQPSAEEAELYLGLGFDYAAGEEGEALVRLLCARAFRPFGFREDLRGSEQADAERAAAIAARLGRPDLELVALDALHSIAGLNGQLGVFGVELCERRLAVARLVSDPFEVSDTYYTSCWTMAEVGRYEDAVSLAAEADARLDALGSVPLGCETMSGIARLSMGDWDGVLADLALMRTRLGDRAEQPPSFASAITAVAALVLELRGDHDGCDRLLAPIASWPRAVRGELRWPLPWAARALAHRGAVGEALEQLEVLRGDRTFRGLMLAGLCDVLAGSGRDEEARATVSEARIVSERSGVLALPRHADRLDAHIRLGAGDPEGALALFRRSAEGFAALGGAWEAALSELGTGEALAVLGREGEARGALERSARVFGRIGAVKELERASELLGGL